MKKLVLLSLFIFCLNQSYSQVFTPPYENDFDPTVDTIGWTHYALYGIDDWELGTPSTGGLIVGGSTPNSWVTDLDNNYAQNSSRVLVTPFFNLSNTTQEYCFSVWYRRFCSTSTMDFFIDYTLDGSSWSLLDANVPKKLWQNSSGFSCGSPANYTNGAIDLSFLQGNDSVQFRFRCVTQNSGHDGWLIDDFSIDSPKYNLWTIQADSILGLNKYFTEFTVNSTLYFTNQYNETYPIKTDFYLSTDLVIDGGDIFLGQINNNMNNTIGSWSNTFPLPPSLSAGTYYVIYETDVLDTLNEFNESDNQNFAVMVIDSIYSAPYSTDFESTQEWNIGSTIGSVSWYKGEPNAFHIENAHSGLNTWNTTLDTTGNIDLESPYLDLSTSVNTVACFWYRNSSNAGENYNINFTTAAYGLPTIESPYYQYNNTLPKESYYGWDCFCKSMNEYDGEISTKVKFKGSSTFAGFGNKEFAFDDFYIGTALPDASIEGLRNNRFTSTSFTSDTLHYLFFNSGLENLPSTTTHFYWSTDSLLDGGDIYLGNNVEIALTDTTKVWNSFVFNKQSTTPGTFYIVYQVDAGDAVFEMRESNNQGYFKYTHDDLVSLPYFNDFENNIDGWTHNSSLGQDEWVWGVPNGTLIDTAFSGTKAFMTNDTGLVSQNSKMHLFSPIYDFTTISDPVIEFDLIFYQDYPEMAASLYYSIDGGANWTVLDTTSQDFKFMYYTWEYVTYNGVDRIPINGSSDFESSFLHGKNQKSFFGEQGHYLTRDYDDITHMCMDIDFLESQTQVQFMFVFSNQLGEDEGVLLDNFEISERKVDLKSVSSKKFMVHNQDDYISENFIIQNDENYTSNETTAKFYFSADTLLGIGDHYIGSKEIPKILPYRRYPFSLKAQTPSSFANYNYLLIELDDQNLNSETNEMNNLAYHELSMDTSMNFVYPLLFDFEQNEIDGWSHYNDSSAYYQFVRFRHKALEGGDYAQQAQSGQYFLDKIENWGGGTDPWDIFAINYLQSPVFDFTDKTNIKLSFDFFCGGANSSSSAQGGNLQYSTDGGITWEPLGTPYDPNATNWYNHWNVHSINEEPGWAHWFDWDSATYNLTPFFEDSVVQFRFQFRSEWEYSGTAPSGFRLDNFLITAAEKNILPQIDLCQGDSVLVFGNYVDTAGIFVDQQAIVNNNDTVNYQEVIVHPAFNLTENFEVCEGEPFTFNDGTSVQALLNDTIHSSSYSTTGFCDSIITEVINVIQINNGISNVGGTLTADQSLANYQWLYCDSNFAEVPLASDQSFMPSAFGNYAVQLELNGCVDTSDCFLFDNSGFHNLPSEILIYPNPTNGQISIQNDGPENFEVVIINTLGQDIEKIILESYSNHTIRIEGSTGMYILRFFNEEFQKNFNVFKY